MKARGGHHRTRSILLAASAVFCMLLLGAALTAALLLRRLPMWLFVVLVAVDGAATGTAQIVAASLGGMLSGSRSDAASALLLGEAAAPPLAALCCALVSLQPGASDDAYQSTLVTLTLPMGVLALALAALSTLLRARPPVGVPLECKTLGIATSNAAGSSLVSMRAVSLLPNAACVSALCACWIFLLCSIPSVAAGLCAPLALGGPSAAADDDNALCLETVPSIMVGVSNVTAFLGRLLGGLLPPGCLPTWALAAETVAVVVLSSYAIFATESRAAGVPNPSATGGALSGGLTLWCNILLMRLSAAAHESAGSPGEHSVVVRPCPITSQITWVAIQSGCVGGSALSFVLRFGTGSGPPSRP